MDNALGQGAKPDERALWAALLAGEQPRYAGERLGIAPRRVEYLCNKWAGRRIYDYGVVHDLGWPESPWRTAEFDATRPSLAELMSAFRLLADSAPPAPRMAYWYGG